MIMYGMASQYIIAPHHYYHNNYHNDCCYLINLNVALRFPYLILCEQLNTPEIMPVYMLESSLGNINYISILKLEPAKTGEGI